MLLEMASVAHLEMRFFDDSIWGASLNSVKEKWRKSRDHCLESSKRNSLTWGKVLSSELLMSDDDDL